MKLNILGTKYTVTVKKYDEDPFFKQRTAGGYHNGLQREIVLCDMRTYPGYDKEPEEYLTALVKESLRHEIVHAFLYCSGLDADSTTFGDGWALNEEMIDWFAMQGQKIYAAWEEADCLG